MKRLLATSLIGCLALSLNLSVATAAVKPGTTCKTLGQTSTSAGMKYTCIKSGKKLVWSKGVKVVKATPAPATTQTPAPVPSITQAPAAANFEPWSINIDAKSLSDQAQQSFLNWAKEKVVVANNDNNRAELHKSVKIGWDHWEDKYSSNNNNSIIIIIEFKQS